MGQRLTAVIAAAAEFGAVGFTAGSLGTAAVNSVYERGRRDASEGAVNAQPEVSREVMQRFSTVDDVPFPA